ncbi:hypothetical protein AAMO2058_000588900 [Amorphochlora amoebiformis]
MDGLWSACLSLSVFLLSNAFTTVHTTFKAGTSRGIFRESPKVRGFRALRGVRMKAETSEELRRRLENLSDALNTEEPEIILEYDKFTRRAAIGSLGLWGFLTSQSINEYRSDKSAAVSNVEFLERVGMSPREVLKSGRPTLIEFRDPDQETDIQRRLAEPIRQSNGRVAFTSVNVNDFANFGLLQRFAIFTTPSLVWIDERGRLVGAATGDIPEGLILVNTNSLARGEKLPYRNAVLPGAGVIDNPVYNTLRSEEDSDLDGEQGVDVAESIQKKLDEALGDLPSATPMDYE